MPLRPRKATRIGSSGKLLKETRTSRMAPPAWISIGDASGRLGPLKVHNNERPNIRGCNRILGRFFVGSAMAGGSASHRGLSVRIHRGLARFTVFHRSMP
jgi:hypothetical protein